MFSPTISPTSSEVIDLSPDSTMRAIVAMEVNCFDMKIEREAREDTEALIRVLRSARQ